MIIRYAEEKNFIELRQFYDGMCKVLSGKDFLPEGDKGGFPPDEMIKDAIKERNQFIGIEDGRIVAAYIMNHDRDEAYHAVKWLIDANDNETVVLHALRVLPEYGGRGYSKQLVQHAIDTARERNLKSIRLDCIEGNDIPQKMYMSFGFKYVDKVEITYADLVKGRTKAFHLFAEQVVQIDRLGQETRALNGCDFSIAHDSNLLIVISLHGCWAARRCGSRRQAIPAAHHRYLP